jgi:hypothetical protein
MRHRALLLLVLLSACPSPQIIGGGCAYQEFHGTCRFVALERGATGQAAAYYDFDDAGQLCIELSIDDDRLAAFDAHLHAHPVLPCAGERIVRGPCVPILGKVEIPAFDGATLLR